MNILLLGGFGFIGTNIMKYIDAKKLDYSVIVFDRFEKHQDNVEFNCLKRAYSGDFSDVFLLNKIFAENKIDIVLHSLSASVPSSSLDNEFDIRFNVLPTIRMLNQMVNNNVNRIVFISSGGAIYGDHYVNNVGHMENEVLFPKSAYGLSKLMIEKYLYLYSIQYGIKSLVLRLSNPYGPYHYSQRQGVINIAIEHAIEQKLFSIWGDGNGRKDYIFIEDFCAILLLLMDRWEKDYTVLNVGSGLLLSVNEIVNVIRDTVNSSFAWEYKKANSLDVQDFKLDLSALHSFIGDFNYTDIKDGIEKTINWLCKS